MKYRAEIDGLRALAVIPVILFHAGFKLFSGGFVGVDVFFVISGYLITTILIEDIEKNRFSIVNFYERRARRILPALLAVVIVSIPFAWFSLLPSEAWDYFQSLTAVSVFSSNILFYLEVGNYFNLGAHTKPLLHTWTLSVEEQFYVIVPLILIFSAKWQARRRNQVFVMLALSSFILMFYLAENQPRAAFYLIFSRAWELLAGSLIAFFYRSQTPKNCSAKSNLGILLILYSIFIFDKNTPIWIYSGFTVIGTALVIFYAGKNTKFAQFLTNKPMVIIGLMSYSLYLWHWPIFVLYRAYFYNFDEVVTKILLITFCFLIAYVSWQFVEKPFRYDNGKVLSTRRGFFGVAMLLISIIATIGLVGHYYKGFPDRISINNYLQPPLFDHKIESERHGLIVSGSLYPEILDDFDPQYKNRVFVIGDSHSIDLMNALYQNKSSFEGTQFKHVEINLNCIQEKNLLGLLSDDKIKKCAEEFKKNKRMMLRQATHIIFSVRWHVWPRFERMIEIYLKSLAEYPVKILLTSNTVEYDRPVPDIAYKLFKKYSVAESGVFPVDKFNRLLYVRQDSQIVNVNERVAKIARSLGVVFIKKYSLLCNEEAKNCYGVTPNNDAVYLDYGHWTLNGAKFIGERIVETNWLVID